MSALASPVSAFNPSLLYSGTRRKLHSLNGGDGIVKCMREYLRVASEMDVHFADAPEVELDDWRQAQLAMARDNMAEYTTVARVKVFEEGNKERETFIVPSSALVKKAQKQTDMDPKAFIKQQQVRFLKVHKKGLASLGDFDELVHLGFDDVMDILDSCVVLHELDMPEIEIKYQCSCYDFWHYYKCHHSLAMSIMKKGVKVPDKYKITNIGSTGRRGRPAEAHVGEALGPKGKKKKP